MYRQIEGMRERGVKREGRFTRRKTDGLEKFVSVAFGNRVEAVPL